MLLEHNQLLCPHLRVAARRWGIDLSVAQLQKFRDYYEELIAWNRRFNLTSITDYDEVQIQHFLDSLSCLLALPRLPSGVWHFSPFGDKLQCHAPCPQVVDVGAGAGFPGFPLKLLRPAWELTLVEATRKKAEFLRHISQRLDLPATIVVARAEECGRDPQHREQYDLVLARAVAELSVLLEYTLPLCRVNGAVIAMKGHTAHAEASAATSALEILGGELHEIIPVTLPGLTETRHLVIVAKVAQTPARFPRRPGRPAKKPL